MAYQTPDSKKEEFRKYLEKSGVIDALTKVLVGLYEEPERPPNAVDYIKRYMGAPTGIDVEALRQENENAREPRPSYFVLFSAAKRRVPAAAP